MTVKQLSKQLARLKDELQDKEVVIFNKHGELLSPDLKFILKDEFNMDKTKENVEYIILSLG